MGADLKPAKLSASADLLGQFITNLLTNAIRYNGNNGEVRIATDVSTWKPNW